MEKAKITIQRLWHPPDKQLPVVITTPEQEQYYCRSAELVGYFNKVGIQVDIDWEYGTNSKGQEIREIAGVAGAEKPADKPAEKKPPKRDTGIYLKSDNSQKSFACSYAKDVVVAIIKTSDKHFDIEKITPKQARGIANLIKAIANDLNVWLISSSEIVEKIEKTIEEG